MRVLAPGVGRAGFRDHAAEARVGDHVGPGRGRAHAGRRGDHVLARIGGEVADAVALDAAARRAVRQHRAAWLGGARGHEGRHAALARRPPVHLIDQAAAAVAEHRARHRLQQDAVLVRDLLGVAHEDAARPVDHMRLHAGRDQAHDLFLQALAVDVALLVPDHQVHRQALQAPPGMRLHQLAHQLDVVGAGDLHQHDRQVTRDRVAPQARLAAPVAQQHAGLGAQAGLGIDHRAGQARVELRVGLAGVQLAQHHLRVRPGQLEHAVGEASVLVLLGQRDAGGAAIAHADDDVDHHRLVGRQRDAAAAGRDRIEHRAGAVGERARKVERGRRAEVVAAADEAGAVGLVADRADVARAAGRHPPAVHRHQLHHPRRGLLGRARAACAEHGGRPRQDLGLHEELAEGRVQRVGRHRREHDLAVARDLDRAPQIAVVGDAVAAQLDVVLRRDGDLGVGVDVAVAAPELGAALGEDGLVVVGDGAHGLVRGRPDLAAGDIAQVAEAAPGIARRILVPARDRQVLPAALPAAGVGDHHVVAAVGQQLDLGRRRVGAGDDTHRRLPGRNGLARAGTRVDVGLRGRAARRALLQQQQGRAQARVGLEATLHRTRQQQVREREQAHALVVGHERAHHDALHPARQARGRVVDGFVEAEAAVGPQGRETLQVGASRRGRDH